MTARAFAIAATLLLLAVFTLLNWSAFLAPTTLSLGVAEVQAPLGLVMLGVTAVISGVFLVVILVQQASVILDSRRMAKDLHAQRELADKAEASRFTEMRSHLDGEIARLEAQAAASTRELGERLTRAEEAMATRVDDAARTLSAHLGEIEDKLDRALPGTRT